MTALPALSGEVLEELRVLMRFNPDCSQQGIKVHHSTAPVEVVAATGRLHAKGLITQPDGGYLTSLGQSALDHARALLLILQPRLH